MCGIACCSYFDTSTTHVFHTCLVELVQNEVKNINFYICIYNSNYCQDKDFTSKLQIVVTKILCKRIIIWVPLFHGMNRTRSEQIHTLFSEMDWVN